MPKSVKREPQPCTIDDCLAQDNGLPEKIELWDGMIGPYEDAGLQTLLANWGVDRVIAVTGPEIWREALAAFEVAKLAKRPKS